MIFLYSSFDTKSSSLAFPVNITLLVLKSCAPFSAASFNTSFASCIVSLEIVYLIENRMLFCFNIGKVSIIFLNVPCLPLN